MTNVKTSPYNETAIEYMTAGWEPFIIPLGEKFPPPKGMTGRARVEEYDEFTATSKWMEGEHNIAVRLPKNIVGVDIDGKEGMDWYDEISEKLGVLPIEFAVTSRENPLREGFTAYFQIPDGREVMLAGIGKKIDLIRSHHRYSVVAPSIHPTGRIYRWIDTDGNNLFDIPEIWDSPLLPEKWVEYMCKPQISVETKMEKIRLPLFMNTQLIDESLNSSEICASMRSFASKDWMNETTSRHDSTLMKILKIASMSKSEHKGFNEAMKIVKKRWESAFSEEEKNRRNIDFEINSMISWSLENSKPFSKNCECGSRKQKRKYPF